MSTIYSCPRQVLKALLNLVKVRQFHNEFIKSLFLQKYEKKLSGFLPCVVRAEFLTIHILGETMTS